MAIGIKPQSFALSHFRMVAHVLRGQSHYLAVTPNVEWQAQTGMFVVVAEQWKWQGLQS
jgi:hypothetical protein